MDTSKNYYESVMRDYRMYKRGRTLELYCRDEGIDFKWLKKAQKLYGEPDEAAKKKRSASATTDKQPEVPDIIKLHYEPEEPAVTQPEPELPEAPQEASSTTPAPWEVSSLTVKTPSGNEIEIRCCKPSAALELLTKLAL